MTPTRTETVIIAVLLIIGISTILFPAPGVAHLDGRHLIALALAGAWAIVKLQGETK